MTLVSPLQLILLGSKKITSNGEIVELDEWYVFQKVEP